MPLFMCIVLVLAREKLRPPIELSPNRTWFRWTLTMAETLAMQWNENKNWANYWFCALASSVILLTSRNRGLLALSWQHTLLSLFFSFFVGVHHFWYLWHAIATKFARYEMPLHVVIDDVLIIASNWLTWMASALCESDGEILQTTHQFHLFHSHSRSHCHANGSWCVLSANITSESVGILHEIYIVSTFLMHSVWQRRWREKTKMKQQNVKIRRHKMTSIYKVKAFPTKTIFFFGGNEVK